MSDVTVDTVVFAGCLLAGFRGQSFVVTKTSLLPRPSDSSACWIPAATPDSFKRPASPEVGARTSEALRVVRCALERVLAELEQPRGVGVHLVASLGLDEPIVDVR